MATLQHKSNGELKKLRQRLSIEVKKKENSEKVAKSLLGTIRCKDTSSWQNRRFKMSIGNLEGKTKAELQELRNELILKGRLSADESVKILAEIQRRIDGSLWT
ncbi:MAG: hypothetical protein Q8O30_06465 [Candidatus Omnitrophota bacterium]|nr:hypothetical protein [Candidatus Omnitrophota bacterium]